MPNADRAIVYLDESGTSRESERMYVGAVIVPNDTGELATVLADVRGAVLANPLLWNDERQRDRIRRQGFHFTKDSLQVRAKVLDAIAPMNFRTHLTYVYNQPLADGKTIGTRIDLLLGMYFGIVLTLLRRYVRIPVVFIFEQNSDLDKLFGRIVAEAVQLLPPRPAEALVTVYRGSKDVTELSVVDYLLGVTRESYDGQPDAYKRRRFYNFQGHVARVNNFYAHAEFYARIQQAAPASAHDVEGESPSIKGSKYVGSHDALRVQSSTPFEHIRTINQLREIIGLPFSVHKKLLTEIEAGTAYKVRVIRGRRTRRVVIPSLEALRNVHRSVFHLLQQLEHGLPRYVHGYVRDRSPVTNALPHAGKKWMQKFDIKDFFDSIDSAMVTLALIETGLSTRLAKQLTLLVTHDNKLPAGACTSPLLSNLVFRNIDVQLASLALERDIVYTRYADDLTFSSAQEFDVYGDVVSAVQTLGFVLNRKKTRTIKFGQSLYVTGLSTSDLERPRLPKSFKRRLRMEDYVISTYGIEAHAEHLGISPAKAERQFEGKLRWALSVEPDILSRLKSVEMTEEDQRLQDQHWQHLTDNRRAAVKATAKKIRQRTESSPPFYDPTVPQAV